MLIISGIETKFKKLHYPVLVSATHVPELLVVNQESEGYRFGSSVSLSTVKSTLSEATENLPEHQTRVFAAVVEMLRWFAGDQIRNVAVSFSDWCSLLNELIKNSCYIFYLLGWVVYVN